MLPLLLGRVPGKLMESGREIGLSSEAGPSVGLHQVGLADLLRRPRSYPVPYCSIAKPCPTLCDPMDYRVPASLSFTISQSLYKLMSIESVMLSNHLIPFVAPYSSYTTTFYGAFVCLSVHIALTHIVFLFMQLY